MKVEIANLSEFLNLVDNIIDGIENGSITANPLKPTETDASEIVIEETATEMGEIRVEETPVEKVSTPQQIDEIWGPKSIKVTLKNGSIERYLNAAEAARDKNLNPTTVRTRCGKNYIDEDGNTWEFNG